MLPHSANWLGESWKPVDYPEICGQVRNWEIIWMWLDPRIWEIMRNWCFWFDYLLGQLISSWLWESGEILRARLLCFVFHLFLLGLSYFDLNCCKVGVEKLTGLRTSYLLSWQVPWIYSLFKNQCLGSDLVSPLMEEILAPRVRSRKNKEYFSLTRYARKLEVFPPLIWQRCKSTYSICGSATME